MTKLAKKKLSKEQVEALISTLKNRFEKNMGRHVGIPWVDVQKKLEANTEKLWSLQEMEITGGEPDIIGYDKITGNYVFADCCAETPKERRSFCYDQQALDSRKEHKPKNSAVGMANDMGIELLTEDEYLQLQQLDTFDTKTSSWLQTPAEIRKLGGAIFGDRRFGRVFIYHNGAESYYAGRGFRGLLKI